MKKILITGENSYIGDAVDEWLQKSDNEYTIDKISFIGDDWKNLDFSNYDSIFHVAGIAHNSADPSLESLYYEVNRDLTIAIANKAKRDGAKQFIFMSSMIVYGASDTTDGMITENTEPKPANFYGDSKWQAELGILPLQDEKFKIAIVRPPMIYGKNSKGNYPLLAKLAKKTPIFPNYQNKRSMLHIDNLSQFIKLLIDNEDSGIFHPQNAEYVITSEMVKKISKIHEHKIWLTKLGNPLVKLLTPKMNVLKKVFGNQTYEQNMSVYIKDDYQIRSFSETIELTEMEESLNDR